MTIIEETDSEYKSELKLWENTDGKIWMQIGYDDTDPCTTQGIPLTQADAKALISELTRLIKQIDSAEALQLNPPWQEKKEPQMSTGQLPFSKVNWKQVTAKK